MWFNDVNWTQAAEFCLRQLANFDWILTPAEFHGLSPRFRPLEYSEAPPEGKIGFLCGKDFGDSLSAAFRDNISHPSNYLFANEVFVFGSTETFQQEIEGPQHLASWLERLTGTSSSAATTQPHTRLGVGTGISALVIGATRFGNVGDDLLAEAIAEKLLTSGQFEQVHLADFTVCRETLRQYNAIYVGGGGLLYASQIGQLDWQNLANYFKFPFWCSADAIPCHLIGVGHQEPERLLELDGPTRRFLRESLRQFHTLTVRDQETAALIWQVGGVRAIAGADLVFSFPRLAPPPQPSGGVLFIGEIFHYPALAAWLQGGEKQLARGRRGFALMSHDDFPHLRRLQEIFGEHLEVHDFRQISPQKIQENLASYNLLVGTRFHGFVLGLLAGVPQIIFDRREGKKHRLIRSVFPELLEQLLFDDATGGEAAALLRKEPGALVNQPPGLEAHLVTTANHFSTPRKVSENAAHRNFLGESLLNENGEIKLCWAAASPGSNGFANLGDGLSAFMIGNLAGLPIRHTNFQEESTRLFGVGSIGHAAKRGKAVIWGTGCYRPDKLVENVGDTMFDVLAVRGPISRECLESVGIRAPKCYGEPVWLLPSMISEPVEKKYELGVICHISDLRNSAPDAIPKEEWSSLEIPDLLKPSVCLINTWHAANLTGLLEKIRLIRSCKRIASRSFHGVVIAEAYGIPCIPICSKPGVPTGAFRSDAVKLALLDRRTLEFFQSATRSLHYFFGQRRSIATDWENLIDTIDKYWSPVGYDATPMLEAFPFEIRVDPMRNSVPIHPCMENLIF